MSGFARPLLARVLLALAPLALVMPVPAFAEGEKLLTELPAGKPLTLRPDRAYILYRTPTMKGVLESDTVFMLDIGRTAYPGDNLARVRNSNPYATSATESFYLVEAIPGHYVIAGQSHKAFRNTETCMCMGTVGFEARAGVITDLGYILTDRIDTVSPVPEFHDLSGRGAQINGFGAMLVSTVRPPTPAMPVPAALSSLPREPADLRAVDKFPNRFAIMVNRMAPIPGILDYDEDRVIDLKRDRPKP